MNSLSGRRQDHWYRQCQLSSALDRVESRAATRRGIMKAENFPFVVRFVPAHFSSSSLCCVRGLDGASAEPVMGEGQMENSDFLQPRNLYPLDSLDNLLRG